MKTNMTKTAIGVLFIALTASGVRAETAADIGTLPSQKVPAPVDQGDRNPFSTRLASVPDETGNYDADTEESKIRQVFANLKVTGRAPASGGAARVLVGDLILKEGGDIPQVIENQTNVLRVTRITEKEVEITWIDEIDADAPRKLLIPINLNPEVSFLLPGRSQGAGQFVTLAKAEQPKSEQEEAGAPAEDNGENNDDDDEREEEEGASPEKPARVSPFGLFRR
jgi:hypothetical protein